MKNIFYIILVLLICIISFFVWKKQAQSPLYDPTQDYTAGDRIQVSSPRIGDIITSPLKVSGKARGTWFFEASFPVIVVDWDGLIIGEGHAELSPAGGDWMTTDYVPFEGTITFTTPPDTGPQSVRGAVIFKKDNPSDLPENDAAVEIPIRFR